MEILKDCITHIRIAEIVESGEFEKFNIFELIRGRVNSKGGYWIQKGKIEALGNLAYTHPKELAYTNTDIIVILAKILEQYEVINTVYRNLGDREEYTNYKIIFTVEKK